MRKYFVVLVSLLFASSASPTGMGIGECVWPCISGGVASGDIQNQPYTPAVGSPTTIKLGLDGKLSISDSLSASSVIQKDGSVTFTSPQPMGGQVMTGLGAGTQGNSAESVRQKDLRPQTPLGLPNLVYIDNMALFGSSLGGLRDDNLSQVANGVETGVDAATDYLTWNSTTYALNAGIGQWQYAVANSMPANVEGRFCRDTTTPFASCISNATAPGGTCGKILDSGNAQHTQLMVVQHQVSDSRCTGAATPASLPLCAASGTAYKYFTFSLNDSGTCTTNGVWTSQGYSGPAVALSAGDLFQGFWTNDAHPTGFGNRLLAQRAALLKKEELVYSKNNYWTNGLAETDCTTSGWKRSSDNSTTNLSSTSYDGTKQYPGTAHSVYGKGCMLANGKSADDGMISTAISVPPETWMQCSGYALSGDATATNGLIFDVVSGTDGNTEASITASTNATDDVNVWHVADGDYVKLAKTSGIAKTTVAASSVNESLAWSKYVMKFYTRTFSSVRIKMSAHGTSYIQADHWWCEPAVAQTPTLTPAWPSGPQTWAFQGDSRVTYSSPYLSTALDDAFAQWRPDMKLTSTLTSNSQANPGMTLAHDEDANLSFLTLGQDPTFGMLMYGTNDLNSGGTGAGARTIKDSTTGPWVAADIRLYWAAARDDLRAIGTVPVIMGEFPTRGDHTTAICQDGTHGSATTTGTCGGKLNKALQLLWTNGDFN